MATFANKAAVRLNQPVPYLLPSVHQPELKRLVAEKWAGCGMSVIRRPIAYIYGWIADPWNDTWTHLGS